MDRDSRESAFAAFERAVAAAGSQIAFASLITKTQQGVSKRLAARAPLWAEDVLKIETATGISRHELRPDIYPSLPAPQRDLGDREPAR